MSALAEYQTPSATADLIPGFILSRPGFTEQKDAEDHFAEVYSRILRTAIDGMSNENAVKMLMMDFHHDMKTGAMFYGNPGFTTWALATTSVPYLTWLCLRVKHPQITLEKTLTFFTPDNADAIAAEVWKLWKVI